MTVAKLLSAISRASLAATAVALALVVVAPVTDARAASRGEVVFIAGYPILSGDLTIGLTNASLSNTMALGVQMNWFLSDLPAAFGMIVQGAFGGPFGFAPLMQYGLTFTYYPLAQPHNQLYVDNEVRVTSVQWTPFLRLQAGIASIVLNNSNPSQFAQIGSTSLSYALVAGVDFPVDWKARPGVEFGYLSTIGAKDFSGVNPIAVTGYLLNLRLSAPWE